MDLPARPPYAPLAHELQHGVSLRSLLAVLRRRRPYFVIPAVLTVLACAALAVVLPARYRAEALLTIESAGLQANEPLPPELDAEHQLRRVTEIAGRRSLLERAAREAGVVAESARLGERDLVDLKARIKARVEGPSTVALGFEDRRPDRAAAMAGRLATLTLEASHAEREGNARNTVGFIEEQLGALRAKIVEQESKLEGYKARWFGELPEQADSNLTLLKGAQDRLAANSATIAELEARRSALARETAELERQGFTRDPSTARLDQARLELSQLRRRYTPEHPEMRRAQAELEALERAVAAGLGGGGGELSPARLRQLELGAELQAVEQRLASARAQEGLLRGESAGFRAQLEAAPRHQTALAALTREYEAARNQYEALVTEHHDARLAQRLEASRTGVFRIVEAPRVPTEPVGPHRLRILLLGLVAGLGIGLAAAFVAEQADPFYRDAEDFDAHRNLPVLAAIPALPARTARGPLRLLPGRAVDQGVALLDEPFGAVSEQYRILAAKLIGRGGAARPSSVLVTSPGAGEGKTTAAVNVALALAWMVREPVLLVDADLGHPSVHRLLGIPRGPGLAALLQRPDDDPGRYVTCHQGLYVLDGGDFTPESRAALGSPLAEKVFRRLRQRFTYVVVDAPPILAVAEGVLLQNVVESIVLVVRAKMTPREMVRRAMESLDVSRIIGVVMTDVEGNAYTNYAYPYFGSGPRAAGAGR